MNPKPKKSEFRRPVLRHLDQLSVGVIVAVCLVAMATYWVYRGVNRGRTLEFERIEPLPVDFRMDINQAEWPELTLLPRVSETLRTSHCSQSSRVRPVSRQRRLVARVGNWPQVA